MNRVFVLHRADSLCFIICCAVVKTVTTINRFSSQMSGNKTGTMNEGGIVACQDLRSSLAVRGQVFKVV